MTTRNKLLVYAENPNSPAYKAMKQVVETMLNEGRAKYVTVSNELEKELKTRRYGLVIDAIAIDTDIVADQTKLNQRHLEDSEKIKCLDSKVKIAFASDITRLVADILKIGGEYIRNMPRKM